MNWTCFQVEISDNVAHVQLSRPEKRNAMNLRFWDELPAIVREIDHQVKARVIVLSSTGPHFTAGLDFKEFFAAETSRQTDERTRRLTRGSDFYHNVARMQDTFSALEQCRIPVLAAVQGGCIGGGVDLVTACDLRYATQDAFFVIEETNIGMTADVGTFPRLLNLMPEGLVREMALTGARLPADDARAAGLVNRVFPDHESLLAGVMEVAAEIASKAPLAVHGCKRIINYAREHSTADTLDYVRLWNASHLNLEEMMEAVQARAEKRPGQFVSLPPIRPAVDSSSG